MFSAEVINYFIVGSLALSIPGNALYGLLTNWFGANSSPLLELGRMALVLGLQRWTLTRLLRRGNYFAVIGKRPL